MQLNAAVVDRPPTADENRVLHQTIRRVTGDIDKLTFNTAIARMMEFTNYFTTASERPRAVLEKFVLLLVAVRPAHRRGAVAGAGARRVAGLRALAGVRPGAGQRGHGRNPGADQRQGARRRSPSPADADQAALEAAARADPRIAELLAGKTDRESRSSCRGGW